MKIKVVSLRNHCGLQFIVVQLEFFMFFYLNIIELFLFLNYLYFTVELKICQSTMYMTSQINMISTCSSNNNMDSKSTEKYRQPEEGHQLEEAGIHNTPYTDYLWCKYQLFNNLVGNGRYPPSTP